MCNVIHMALPQIRLVLSEICDYLMEAISLLIIQEGIIELLDGKTWRSQTSSEFKKDIATLVQIIAYN